MDDEKLISLVENFEELYNSNHPGYSDGEKRTHIWKTIGKILCVSDETCRKRWRSIRRNYTKYMELRRNRQGFIDSSLRPPPNREKALAFLLPHLNPVEKVPKTTGEPHMKRHECDINHPVDVPQCQPEISFSSQSLQMYEIANNGSLPQNGKEAASSSGPWPSFFNYTQRRVDMPQKRRRSLSAEMTSLAPAFLHHQQVTEHYEPASDEDSLMSFFKSIAETVKTFPVGDQLYLKERIFMMVHAMERGHAMERRLAHI